MTQPLLTKFTHNFLDKLRQNQKSDRGSPSQLAFTEIDIPVEVDVLDLHQIGLGE